MIIKITNAVFYTDNLQSETDKFNGLLLDYNELEDFRQKCIAEINQFIKGDITLNLTYQHIAYDCTGKD